MANQPSSTAAKASKKKRGPNFLKAILDRFIAVFIIVGETGFLIPNQKFGNS
jgi:hypothetical protein